MINHTMNNDNKFLNILIGGMQKHQSIKTDGISTCLTSSMGMGGVYSYDCTQRNKKVSIIGKWMIDKKHKPEGFLSSYACTLLSRDWKGANNYGFNFVIEKGDYNGYCNKT